VNFLTLVRETLNDAGVGTSSSVTSVGSLTDGHAGMVKRAVVEAWLHIQNLDDAWTFMQGSGEIVIRDGVSRYPVEEMGSSSQRPSGTTWRVLLQMGPPGSASASTTREACVCSSRQPSHYPPIMPGFLRLLSIHSAHACTYSGVVVFSFIRTPFPSRGAIG